MLGLGWAIGVRALPARSGGVTRPKLSVAPRVVGSDWAAVHRQGAEQLPSRCPMGAMEARSVALVETTPPTADSPQAFAAASSSRKRAAPASWSALVKIPSPQAFAAAASSMKRAGLVSWNAQVKMPQKCAPNFRRKDPLRFRGFGAGQRRGLHFSTGWWRGPLGIHLITCPWMDHRRGEVMVVNPPLTIGPWETQSAGSSSSHWTAPMTNDARLMQHLVAKQQHSVGT